MKRVNHFVTLLDFEGDIRFQNENMSSIEAEELIKGDIKSGICIVTVEYIIFLSELGFLSKIVNEVDLEKSVK